MGDTISLEPLGHDAQAAVAPRHSCSGNHTPPAPAGDQQIDPVCGMAVTASIEKLRDHFDGNDYFFCGPRCLDKFRAEPARYAVTGEKKGGETSTSVADAAIGQIGEHDRTFGLQARERREL